jgi:hypothetical protein
MGDAFPVRLQGVLPGAKLAGDCALTGACARSGGRWTSELGTWAGPDSWDTTPPVELTVPLCSGTEERPIVEALAPRTAEGAMEVRSLTTAALQETHARAAPHSAIIQRFIGPV